MKKFSIMSLAMVSLAATTLATAGTTAFAATTPADSQNSAASVGFKTPSANALILTKAANLDFGNHPISKSDETYDNVATAKDTSQVQDLRGTGAGWYVQITQGSVLKNGDSELTGSQIKFTGKADNNTAAADTTTLVPGTASTVWSAGTGHGEMLSNLVVAPKSSTLMVPGATKKVAGTYTANLKWDLIDGVPNSNK